MRAMLRRNIMANQLFLQVSRSRFYFCEILILVGIILLLPLRSLHSLLCMHAQHCLQPIAIHTVFYRVHVSVLGLCRFHRDNTSSVIVILLDTVKKNCSLIILLVNRRFLLRIDENGRVKTLSKVFKNTH